VQDLSKTTGDSFLASEWSQANDELNNVISSRGIALSGGDLAQSSKAIANAVSNNDAYIDGGAVNAYVLSTIGSQPGPTAYLDKMRIRFTATNANTASPVTVNVNGLGLKNLEREDGSDLSDGEISSSGITEAYYDDGAGVFKKIGTNNAVEVSSVVSRNLVLYETNSLLMAITSEITEGVFESVGPTGSGADFVWAELDSIPAGATSIYASCSGDMVSLATATSESQTLSVHRRFNGSATANSVGNRILFVNSYSIATEDFHAGSNAVMHIPLDGANRFEIFWVEVGGTVTSTAFLNILGYGLP